MFPFGLILVFFRIWERDILFTLPCELAHIAGNIRCFIFETADIMQMPQTFNEVTVFDTPGMAYP